jgi:GT2 family glycosyltransferase
MSRDMVKISAVTPASRDFISLSIPFLSLLSQDFDDYEWIIVDKKYYERENLIIDFNQVLGNRIVHIPEEERSGEYFWGLCHAMNTALKKVRGELVVIVQDYMWFPPNAISKLWNIYTQHKDWAVSTIIHVIDEKFILKDVRKMDWVNDIIEISYVQFEMNFCSIPAQILRDIGGWNEEFDKGWHYENQDVALRCQKRGYKLMLHQGLETYHFRHTPPEKVIKDGVVDEKLWMEADERNKKLIMERG